MTVPKIMLIDDDPDILKIGTLSLTGIARWQVATASSGKEAIHLAPQEEPDLIVLDTSMPDMDGLTVMAKLREAPVRKKVPILFSSTHVEAGEEDFYKSKGASGLIAKPFNPETLAQDLLDKAAGN